MCRRQKLENTLGVTNKLHRKKFLQVCTGGIVVTTTALVTTCTRLLPTSGWLG